MFSLRFIFVFRLACAEYILSSRSLGAAAVLLFFPTFFCFFVFLFETLDFKDYEYLKPFSITRQIPVPWVNRDKPFFSSFLWKALPLSIYIYPVCVFEFVEKGYKSWLMRMPYLAYLFSLFFFFVWRIKQPVCHQFMAKK